jgi:hypothetical protein
VSGQVTIQDIGWFHKDFRIHTRIESPHINVERSHSYLKISDKQERTDTRVGVLMLVDPLPGNTKLSINNVHVNRASW